MKPSRAAPGLGDNRESLSCPVPACRLAVPSTELCSSDPLGPFLILLTSNSPGLHSKKTPTPSPWPSMGLKSESKRDSNSSYGDVTGKVLQEMMNGLLPHGPFNVYTVKGVEIVPALAQKRRGAENGRGKLKLITTSPAWKGNAGQAVRIELAGGSE